MYTIVIEVVALNCLVDFRRSATHRFIEHLKKYYSTIRRR